MVDGLTDYDFFLAVRCMAIPVLKYVYDRSFLCDQASLTHKKSVLIHIYKREKRNQSFSIVRRGKISDLNLFSYAYLQKKYARKIIRISKSKNIHKSLRYKYMSMADSGSWPSLQRAGRCHEY